MSAPTVRALLACALLAAPAIGHSAPPPSRAAPAATYAEECGACHVAYPARLLSADQWGQILSRLDAHFGVDAALDPAAAAAVAAHLGASSSRTTASTALPRITAQDWFRREHRGRDPSGARGPVKWSQCDACHTRAASGRFDDEEER